MAQSKNITQEEKIWGAVSYIWILSIVALAARKNNDYVRFHANQGFLLFVLSLFFWFPIFGWILSVAVTIMAVIGILKSLKGEEWQLPVLSNQAKQIGDWFIKTIKL